MCCILGSFSGREPLDKIRFDCGDLDQMRHRGPDGQGWYLGTNVQMGFRRLAIIDLAGGQQPLYNEDEQIILIINGEIYNHRVLRDAIKDRHRFRTRVDGETLLHLYEEHDTDFLRLVNGMFAFALYDRRRNRLILGRDRAGKKPLYYRCRDGVLEWASELRVLVRRDRPPIDPVAVNDYLRFGYVPAPLTLLQGIYKLPAAHMLVVDQPQTPVSNQYWRLSYVQDLRSSVPDREAADWAGHIHKELDDAVRMRLESEVPMGFLLSGGVDSASVFALGAAALDHGRARAYTIAFPGEAIDETAAAAEVAVRYQATHHTIGMAKEMVRDLGSIMRSVEEPVSTDALLPTDEVFQAVRASGITVVMAGEGADEVFAGYRKFRLATQGADAIQLGVTALERYLACEEFVFPSRSERVSLLAREVDDRPFDALEQEVGELDPMGQMLAIENRLRLPDRINLRLDKLSMAHSIEARAPFMDHCFREVAASSPRCLLLDQQTEKRILRMAMQDSLPQCVIGARKAPFHSPGAWHTQSQSAQQVLSREAVNDAGMIRYEPIAMLQTQSRNDPAVTERLYSLYVLHMWHRHFYQSLS